MKKCSKCKKLQKNEHFNKRQASKDGLGYWCKKCCNQYSVKYHVEHLSNRTTYFCSEERRRRDNIRRNTRYYQKKGVLPKLKYCQVCGSKKQLENHHTWKPDTTSKDFIRVCRQCNSNFVGDRK